MLCLLSRTLDHQVSEHTEVSMDLPSALTGVLLSTYQTHCTWGPWGSGHSFVAVDKHSRRQGGMGLIPLVTTAKCTSGPCVSIPPVTAFPLVPCIGGPDVQKPCTLMEQTLNCSGVTLLAQYTLQL